MPASLGRRGRGFKCQHGVAEPALRHIPSTSCIIPVCRSDLGDQRYAVTQPVKNCNQRRAQQHRVRRIDHGFSTVGYGFDLPDHVIPEITKQASRHGGRPHVSCIADSAIKAHSDSIGLSSTTSKSSLFAGSRLISASCPRHRQIRSGARSITEKRPRTSPPSKNSSRKLVGVPAASFS